MGHLRERQVGCIEAGGAYNSSAATGGVLETSECSTVVGLVGGAARNPATLSAAASHSAGA